MPVAEGEILPGAARAGQRGQDARRQASPETQMRTSPCSCLKEVIVALTGVDSMEESTHLLST